MNRKLKIINVAHLSDASLASREAKSMALEIGFNNNISDEISLVVKELATNLCKHAASGKLIIKSVSEDNKNGIQIESLDKGKGIVDIERAITDGFSTSGSLGYGLGTVNRLMDDFNIDTQCHGETGTHIVCKRWLRENLKKSHLCSLEFGAATRPHPQMKVNGDSFVIKHWESGSLVAAIDGLGHGTYAHRASESARKYVDSHYDLPLGDIFRGTSRALKATRGAVMALARFDYISGNNNKKTNIKLTFGSIGNIEVRVVGSSERMSFIMRRGIIGGMAPNPVISEHEWNPENILILHSDGLRTHWKWDDFSKYADQSATVIAQNMLRTLMKDNDDAVIIVVKGLVQ